MKDEPVATSDTSQEPVAKIEKTQHMIYMTFNQWADGNFLETGEPRREAYAQAELDLVEMGWNYGYDAGVQWQLEKVAQWMIDRGYATGHGDTIADLLKELEWQIRENERNKCANICFDAITILNLPSQPEFDGDVRHIEKRVAEGIGEAIRARGQA